MPESKLPREVAYRASRRWPLVSALTALGLVAVIALIVVYREANKPFGFEVEWMGELVEHRGQPWTALAMIFNNVGGGILAIAVIPVVIIVSLLLFRRPWAALYYAAATILVTGLVQLVKHLVDRPRPADILVAADPGSFPSGHSANAAVMAATFAVIFPRVWVWVAGGVYTIGMMLSRTYLGAHWISDTVGGLLIGVAVAIILWAPLATKLHREAEQPHPPIWRRTLST